MTRPPTRRLAFLALLAAAPALSAADSRPAWVEGESRDFPRARFVLGVGSGDDDGSAGDRARAEIARVFKADVNAISSVEESESASKQGGAEARSYSMNVAQKVQTAARKALEGVDIVARWKDASSGRCYALAALPKDKAMQAVLDKTREIDAESGPWKEKLASAADRFERAKAAAKLLALAKARGELEADARVLGGGAMSGDADVSKFKSDAVKALAALDVVVIAVGEGAEDVETGVIAGLNAAGLSAKHGAPGDKGDLVAEAAVALAPVEGGDARWKGSRAKATVTLKDGREGKTFSRFDISERKSSADVGEARHRALTSLSKKLADKVKSSISEFFENQ